MADATEGLMADCYDPKTERVRQHLRTRDGSDEFNVRQYWRRPRGSHRLY